MKHAKKGQNIPVTPHEKVQIAEIKILNLQPVPHNLLWVFFLQSKIGTPPDVDRGCFPETWGEMPD